MSTDAIIPDLKASDSLTCETCGVPIEYAGRGRKPRFCAEHRKGGAASTASGTGAGRGSATAAATRAAETLDDAYNGLSMLLLMFGLTDAASDLSASLPALKERNRRFLAADPKLAKAIAKFGEGGGRAAFIASNVMVLAPVGMTVGREIAARLAARRGDDADAETDGATAYV